MKALTLTQPWASLVALGVKRIETRSWSTAYRGRLAIHAAKGYPNWARELSYVEPFFSALLPLSAGGAGPIIPELPRGVILATARLFDVWPTDGLVRFPDEQIPFGDFGPRRYAWMLDEIRPLAAPVPASGALGLWDWQP